MDAGWVLGGNGKDGMTLTKGGHVLRADIRIPTRKGCIWAVYIRPHVNTMATVGGGLPHQANPSKVYELLGPMSVAAAAVPAPRDGDGAVAPAEGEIEDSAAEATGTSARAIRARERNEPGTAGMESQVGEDWSENDGASDEREDTFWIEDTGAMMQVVSPVSDFVDFSDESDGERVGKLVEYGGRKVEVKMTQLVTIRSDDDEFELPSVGAEPRIPAEAGVVLAGGEMVTERNIVPKKN